MGQSAGKCCESQTAQDQEVKGEIVTKIKVPNDYKATTETGIPPGNAGYYDKQMRRPKRIILIRHGESEGNVNRKITMQVPDHMIHLTAKGREQASTSGKNLKAIVGDEGVHFMVSPYTRTQETLNGVAYSFGGREKCHVREDAYIREQDFGNFDKPEARELHKEKKVFGKFYYRFPEGESPADVYIRAGVFLESLYRRWETHYVDNLVIVSHELFITVFLMRMFRYAVSDYYSFEGMGNGELVVLERPPESLQYEITYCWVPGEPKRPGGLKRKKQSDEEAHQMWDGNPSSPLIESAPLKS
mmetsp:Transcript_22456/g.41326  ORF Transcript_22456/g.41326 Transcript_22456/m.41326 type:complete len:302 (-) Transcript_22456:52-957(-)